MIESIVSGFLIAVFVGLFLAIVGCLTLGFIAVVAIVKFRMENGDIYLEDNEDDSDKY